MNFEDIKTKIVGKTLEQAKSIVSELGVELRVVSENGVGRQLTADYRMNRIGVGLVNNVISVVENG
jgi:hypothetical protein